MRPVVGTGSALALRLRSLGDGQAAPAAGLPGPLRARAQVLRGLAVFGFYLAVAFLYRGRFTLRGGTIGVGPDVQIFLWGLRWWPYALGHGLDPLVSHVVWGPYGSDVLWTTTVPALSLLMAPVTLTLGPAVAWNVLCVLALASAAFTAYLLCRELSGRLWPSVAGGMVFGFSSYELAEGVAHLHAAATFLVPLAVLAVIRCVRGRTSGLGLAVQIGAIAVLQFLISPEILVTMVTIGALTAAAAAIALPDHRPALARATLRAAAGLAGGALVLAPLVAQMLIDGPPPGLRGIGIYSSDLANFVIPTRITGLGGAMTAPISLLFAGNVAEQSAYLGVPLLAIVVCFAVARRSDPVARVLLVVLVATAALSLGSRLQVAGHASIWLPGALLFGLPGLADAMPARFMLYASLAAAAIIALWLAGGTRRRWRWAAVAVALASLGPATTATLQWRATPPAIGRGDLARLIRPGSTVVFLPFWRVGERGLYAQAAANMRFVALDVWMQAVPAQDRRFAASRLLSEPQVARRDVAAFHRCMCAMKASYAVVWNDGHYLAALGLRPVRADNLLVYRLPPCATGRTYAGARARRSRPWSTTSLTLGRVVRLRANSPGV